MKLPLLFCLFAIAGFIAPAATAGQQSGDVGWGQKARPDPVVAPDSAVTPATQFDAVYSVCGPMHSADQSTDDIETDNLVSPVGAVYSYFESRGILLNRATGLGDSEPVQVKLLKAPTHGVLVPGNQTATYFIYHAESGYLGADQMAFEVEILGKKFKVIDTLVIHNSGNLEYPTKAAKELFDKYCPSDKGSSLDIIELPTDGFVSAS